MAFDFFTPPTLDEVKATIANFAALGKLALDSWLPGDPGEQLYLAFALTVETTGKWVATIARGRSLDTATDPGDPDPYNPGNEDLEPVPGALSECGEGDYYTTRIPATYATTSVQFINTGIAATQPFAPGFFTLSQSGKPDITYRMAPMAGVYTGPGGTTTIPAGATVYLDVSAESPGTASNADPGTIDTLVSALPGVTVTNLSSALGTNREDPQNYRDRCREQAASVSPNGGADAYRYLSRTLPGGKPLLQSTSAGIGGDGVTPVGITRVYVSAASTTGVVNVYCADDDGASSTIDVATASENILLNVIAVPDAITISVLAAIATNITVTWAVKYQAKYLGKAIAGADVKAAVNAALIRRFKAIPIGGFDQVAGAGFVYLEYLRGAVESAHPAIYNATLSSPAGTTSLALGHVAVNVSPTGTETAG